MIKYQPYNDQTFWRYTQHTATLFINDCCQDGDEVDFFNRGQIFGGIAANEKEFGQKRAKCVKLEKCTATPGSAHLEQGIYASQVSLCFDKKANEQANVS